MTANITLERPDTHDAVELITELEAHLETLYPQESRHGYSVDKLIAQGVAFFVLRVDDTAAGCGGIQFFGTEYGEVKRMYVRPQFRGQGYGKLILDHLANYARTRGVAILRLETGIYQPDAIRLYERFGFQRISAFGSYIEDPLCLYYEKLQPSPSNEMPAAIERLWIAIRTLPGVLAGFSEAESEQRPSPERWTKKEVVGHLIDSASNNHHRFVRGQLNSGQNFPRYEQEQWVRIQDYQASRWLDLIDLWRAYNTHLLHVAECMPEEGRCATCRVGSGPEVTLAWLFVDYVDHLEHHLRKMLGRWEGGVT